MDLEKKFLSDFFNDLNANRVALPTLPEVAMQVRKAVGDPQATAGKIERKKLHTMIGPAVLDEWGFAPYLVAVAAEHEQINEKREGEVDHLDVVIVANLHSYLGTGHRLAKINWDEVPAFARLGITPDESIALMEETREEMREMQGILAS